MVSIHKESVNKLLIINELPNLASVQAWEHRLSSVPRTEALALPIKVEQTTPEPTPI